VKTTYAVDPEKVRHVLEKVAAECPLILQQPKPGASFDSFGPNGFEFSLSANVADFNRRGAAMSDLRHRIVKAFRQEGIEMPYAQYDVHLRDLDFVKSLVQRMQDGRVADAPRPPKSPAPAEPPAKENRPSSVEVAEADLRSRRRS
jgi:small-conductance mechanosensitive channel